MGQTRISGRVSVRSVNAPPESRHPAYGLPCPFSAQPDLCVAARELYSITSSARASKAFGKDIPSAFAVFMLRTNSIFVTC